MTMRSTKLSGVRSVLFLTCLLFPLLLPSEAVGQQVLLRWNIRSASRDRTAPPKRSGDYDLQSPGRSRRTVLVECSREGHFAAEDIHFLLLTACPLLITRPTYSNGNVCFSQRHREVAEDATKTMWKSFHVSSTTSGRPIDSWVCYKRPLQDSGNKTTYVDTTYVEKVIISNNSAESQLVCTAGKIPRSHYIAESNRREDLPHKDLLPYPVFEVYENGSQFSSRSLSTSGLTAAYPLLLEMLHSPGLTFAADLDCRLIGTRQITRIPRHVQTPGQALTNPVKVLIDIYPPSDQPLEPGSHSQVRCRILSVSETLSLSLWRQRHGEKRPTRVDDIFVAGGLGSDTNSFSIATATKKQNQLKDTPLGSNGAVERVFSLQVATEDNGAILYCQVNGLFSTGGSIESERRQLNVTFAPTGVQVTAEPLGAVIESVQKVFTCQLKETGSNPPSNLIWTHLDADGGRLSLDGVTVGETVQKLGSNGGYIAMSTLRIVARRMLNGRRFECTAIYKERKTMYRSEELLEVKFAPNNIGLNAQPMNGVLEGGRLEFACSTSSCHPPAVIRWFEVSPQAEGARQQSMNDGLHELTDLAHVDLKLGKFGGTEVSSRLSVTKTYRVNQNTLFRCLVEHPGMETNVVKEHRLQVLYPPTLSIVSVPSEPAVGQTTLLYCQASEGNPPHGFVYSWFVGDILQTSNPQRNSSDKPDKSLRQRRSAWPLSPTARSSYHVTESDGAVVRAQFDQGHSGNELALEDMVRINGESLMVLNLSRADSAHRGWYACQTSGPGGKAHATFYLDLLYPPLVVQRSPPSVSARVGDSLNLVLTVDANPPRAEAAWFHVVPAHFVSRFASAGSPEKAGPGPDQTYVPSTDYNYRRFHDYDRVLRRRVRRFSLITDGDVRLPVGRYNSHRPNIIARHGVGAQVNLTFILSFESVAKIDFGHYLCQIRHQLGIEEFDFEITVESDLPLTSVSSFTVIQRGQTTIVRFQPILESGVTNVVLRVCRRDALWSQLPTQTKSRLSRHPVETIALGNSSNSRRSTARSGATGKAQSLRDGCEDYYVANPRLGETKVRLADGVQLYNFRLIYYSGSRLVHETAPVVWQPEMAHHTEKSPSVTVAATISTICFLLLCLLSIFVIVYVIRHQRRRRRRQKSHGDRKSQASDRGATSNNPQPTNESEKGDLLRVGNGLLTPDMRSDLGSLRSYQPSIDVDTIPLVQQVPHLVSLSPQMVHGYGQPMVLGNGENFNSIETNKFQRSDSMVSQSPSLNYPSSMHNRLSVNSAASSVSPGLVSHQLIAEAYLAAARAASEAMVASAVAGENGSFAGTPGRQSGSDSFASVGDCRRSGSGVADVADEASRTNTLKSSIHNPNLGRTKKLSESMASNTSLSVNQANLNAAVHAAAAAAVASVVRHVNASGFMLHNVASSANNLIGHYSYSRPPSRAASVAEPRGLPIPSRFGADNRDVDSFNYAAYMPGYLLCASNGELTPTASQNQLYQRMNLTTSQQSLRPPTGSLRHIFPRTNSQAGPSRNQLGKAPGHHLQYRGPLYPGQPAPGCIIRGNSRELLAMANPPSEQQEQPHHQQHQQIQRAPPSPQEYPGQPFHHQHLPSPPVPGSVGQSYSAALETTLQSATDLMQCQQQQQKINLQGQESKHSSLFQYSKHDQGEDQTATMQDMENCLEIQVENPGDLGPAQDLESRGMGEGQFCSDTRSHDEVKASLKDSSLIQQRIAPGGTYANDIDGLRNRSETTIQHPLQEVSGEGQKACEGNGEQHHHHHHHHHHQQQQQQQQQSIPMRPPPTYDPVLSRRSPMGACNRTGEDEQVTTGVKNRSQWSSHSSLPCQKVQPKLGVNSTFRTAKTEEQGSGTPKNYSNGSPTLYS